MLIINRRIIDSCFFKFERRVRHNTKIENYKFFLHVFIENFFYIKKKKSCWPTAIKIAVGQQLSFWPFLQLNVEMAVKETNSHFGYLFSFSVGMQTVKK
jgi:hypothetical protein